MPRGSGSARVRAQLRADGLAREARHRNRSEAQRLADCRALLLRWRDRLAVAQEKRDEARARTQVERAEEYDQIVRELRCRIFELSEALGD